MITPVCFNPVIILIDLISSGICHRKRTAFPLDLSSIEFNTIFLCFLVGQIEILSCVHMKKKIKIMKIEKTPLKSDFLFCEKTQYSLLVSYNVEKS